MELVLFGIFYVNVQTSTLRNGLQQFFDFTKGNVAFQSMAMFYFFKIGGEFTNVHFTIVFYSMQMYFTFI